MEIFEVIGKLSTPVSKLNSPMVGLVTLGTSLKKNQIGATILDLKSDKGRILGGGNPPPN